MKKELLIQVENYEKSIKELVGKSISFINYFEIDYGEPFWDETDFHSLDYGLELITNDNETYYFIWGNEFTQYDVKFRQGKISNEFAAENNVKEYLQINNPKWNELINRKIIGIESIWSYWNHLGDNKKNYYPETVRLDFDNGKNIWILAIEIRENKINGMADHMTIIFDADILAKYKIEMKNVV